MNIEVILYQEHAGLLGMVFNHIPFGTEVEISYKGGLSDSDKAILFNENKKSTLKLINSTTKSCSMSASIDGTSIRDNFDGFPIVLEYPCSSHVEKTFFSFIKDITVRNHSDYNVPEYFRGGKIEKVNIIFIE